MRELKNELHILTGISKELKSELKNELKNNA